MGYLCLTLNTLNVVNITLGDLALLPPWAGEDSCESQSLWCRGERYTSRAKFFFATALPLIFFSLKGESVVFKQAPKEEKGGGTGEGD